MLCACSGEQFRLEEAPQSPESLATRDFSVSGISAKTIDWDTKLDDAQVDEVESALKETLSLNYEEARALLGRLEYQRGNYDAALQVFQGIDVRGLKPKMVTAIMERMRAKKVRNKAGISNANVMSLHSVSLLIEAVLLKSKALEGLGREKEAAVECTVIIDIAEAAWPSGMPEGIGVGAKLKEMFHKALELLPQLWKKAGYLEEAITAYRKAIMKPWNLDPEKLTSLQKDLAALLLYGGVESVIPLQLCHIWGISAPLCNLEEAILLLSMLLRNAMGREIGWDPEIMELLTFALSSCGHFQYLADSYELILPGFYTRGERWYLLALCYSAADEDEASLNLLKRVFCCSDRNCTEYFPSLLLALKLCARNKKYAFEGVEIARKALEFANLHDKHLISVVNHWLGSCCGCSSRSSVTDSERSNLQKEALQALQFAAGVEEHDPEVLFDLAQEFAMQRKLSSALVNAIKYSDSSSGSSPKGWKLLAMVLSANQKFKEAEAAVSIALDETGKEHQLEFLRMRAALQHSQGHVENAIETYKNLLAIIRANQELQAKPLFSEVDTNRNFEIETWLDLANIYRELDFRLDSEICLNRAKAIAFFVPQIWHAKGQLMESQSLPNIALATFATALSIDPDYVPSMIATANNLMRLGSNALPLSRSFLMNALRLDPMNHEAWRSLGHVSKAEGLLVQAADCFQAAYELKLSAPVTEIT